MWPKQCLKLEQHCTLTTSNTDLKVGLTPRTTTVTLKTGQLHPLAHDNQNVRNTLTDFYVFVDWKKVFLQVSNN